MPKPYTCPTLYNEVLQIHLSKLKEWGYLDPGTIINTIIEWSNKDVTTGRISIIVNNREQPYIELNYKYNNEPRKYKIKLVSVPSNLGKGKILYFLCPVTGKRCRKLYNVGGYFLHREAFNGCMYRSQTHSKAYRDLGLTFGYVPKLEKLYDKLYKKHFKRTYAGKPTKKYLKITGKINEMETSTIDINKLKRYLFK